jgi:hypothetical protein
MKNLQNVHIGENVYDESSFDFLMEAMPVPLCLKTPAAVFIGL